MSPSVLILTMAMAISQPAPKAAEKAPPFGSFKLRHLGPATTSGRVVNFAVHPKDRSTYYVAVASGGVWKTTNGGTTYTPVFDNEGSYSIGCVVLDPKDPNTVWVGTGENNSQRSVAYGDGVYKSTDGGKSWQTMGLKTSEHIGKILIHPTDSNTVYVAAQGPLWGPGGDRGLYKTTDGGKNWNRVLAIDDNTGVTSFVLDPRNPETLIAASYQRRRHVWTIVNGGPGSGIHRSTDGGKTWKKLGGGLPGGELGRIGLAQAPTDPDTIYAIIEGSEKNGGIFRSTDGGLTWEKRNPFDSQAQYYSQINVDPANKDRIYVMNVIIQVSDDGGKTLKSLSEGSKHVDNHDLWIDPKDPKYYLCGCDGGIYESHDAAANWHFKGNLPVTQFYDIGVDQNPKSGQFYHVYGGTQDNFTLGGPVRTRSNNGITNSDWYVVQGGDGFHCKVDPEDPNIVYAEYQYAGLCRFDRRTGTRIDIKPMPRRGEAPLRWNWDSPFIISPHSSKRLYFAANKLFRSDDRGETWVAVSGDLTREIDRNKLKVFGKVQSPEAIFKGGSTSFYGNIVSLAESPLKEGVIYVGTDDGLIQVTTDGGKNWTKIEKFPGVPEGTYVSKLVAGQHDAGTVYACFDAHKNADFKPYILKSTDSGKTWAPVSGDLPERGTVYCIAEDHVNADLLFCGTEFGLFGTANGGKQWHRMRYGLPTIQVKDMVIQKHNNDLVIGTFGRGFYVLDDYSPLREFVGDNGKANMEKAAYLVAPKNVFPYVQSSQLGGGGKSFQGASFYTADNPPFGATFTVHLKETPKTLKQIRKDKEREAEKAGRSIEYPTADELRAEAEEEAPSVTMTILQGDRAVTKLIVPASEGLHRITWYLREAGVNAESDQGGYGILVQPGKYKATLSQRVRGKQTALLEQAVDFELIEDPLQPAKPEARDAAKAFTKELKDTQKQLNATVSSAQEATTKLETLRKAFRLAEKPNEEAETKVREAAASVRDIQRLLTGDRVLSAKNENVPVAVAERVRYAVGVNEEGTGSITTTARQQLKDAQDELKELIPKLREILEKDIPALEKQLEAAGGPPLPGRLPKEK